MSAVDVQPLGGIQATRLLVLRNYILQHPRCNERHRRELHLPERRSL